MRLAQLLLALTTTTATAQWTLHDAHTAADLRGIDALPNGVAWASGSHGTILRTEDAGFVWQLCTIPPDAQNLDFRAIQAFSNNTALVMSSGKGPLSRLYKTTDGCQTWQLIFTNPDPDGFWDALSIRHPEQDDLGRPPDNSHAWGFILGDPVDGTFRLFSTADGGETWSRRVAEKRGPKGIGCKIDEFHAKDNESVFAASNEALLTLNGEYLLFATGGAVSRLAYTDTFSLDGALCHESTHFLDLPLAHGNASSGAFAFAVKPETRQREVYPTEIVAVGGDYKRPDTADGTAAYVKRLGEGFLVQKAEAPQTPPHGYRSAVAYDKQSNTWITVGPNGTDISTDNGQNWRPLKPSPTDPPGADSHFNALSLPYAVGPHGRIANLQPNRLQKP